MVSEGVKPTGNDPILLVKVHPGPVSYNQGCWSTQFAGLSRTKMNRWRRFEKRTSAHARSVSLGHTRYASVSARPCGVDHAIHPANIPPHCGCSSERFTPPASDPILSKPCHAPNTLTRARPCFLCRAGLAKGSRLASRTRLPRTEDNERAAKVSTLHCMPPLTCRLRAPLPKPGADVFLIIYDHL